MRFPFSRRNQSGDTIVEVLIAIAVVSTILMSAFLVTSKSVTGVRNSQEHSEMLQILQSQVEHVRALAISQKTDTDGIFKSGGFCIDTSVDPPTRIDDGNSKCTDVESRYKVSVSFDNTSNVFTFTGSWTSSGGSPQKEQLSYRVYSGKPFAVQVAPANPSQAGNPNGEAKFGGKGPITCGASLGLPPCNSINPKGHYSYVYYTYNLSDNDPSQILGCVWNWGDGTISTFGATAPQCQYQTQVTHTYPRSNPELPYPQSCNTKTYKVILTMKIAGVSPDPTHVGYASFAYCGGK